MSKRKFYQTITWMVLLAGSVSVTSSLAWLHPSTQVGGDEGETNILPIDGSSASTYFAYGNGKQVSTGTVNRPYGIATPRHFYNLSWLTYL